MGPTQNLSYMVHHLAMVIGKQSEDILMEHLGIGLSQYRILAVMDWNPRVQQSFIAETLGQSEASVSRQMKILEKMGLVEVEQDQNNRRKHIAKPTTKAMQLTESATALLRRNLSSDYDQLGEEELTKLMTSLQKLHKQVCRPGKNGACNHPQGV